MAIDRRKVVVVDTSKIAPPREQPRQLRKGPSPESGKNMIISKFVTRLPRHTWRSDSRGMVLHHEVNMFAKKTKENFVTLLITIVGMATALTWNEVVRALIDTFFADRSVLYAKLYVAVIATIFTLVATYMISRIREGDRR